MAGPRSCDDNGHVPTPPPVPGRSPLAVTQRSSALHFVIVGSVLVVGLVLDYVFHSRALPAEPVEENIALLRTVAKPSDHIGVTTDSAERPSRPGPENLGVIIYLVNTKKASSINAFRKSLNALDVNFNRRFNYPVFVYHDEEGFGVSPERQAAIQEGTSSNLTFFRVEDFSELQRGFAPDMISEASRIFSLPYRFMCRYWFVKVIERPELRSFRYYWRFDDQSMILAPIDRDPFRYMADRGLRYGYRLHWSVFGDPASVTEMLWNFTAHYAISHGVTPQFYETKKRSLSDMIESVRRDDSSGVSLPSVPIYYTNFEIVDIPFYRDEKTLRNFRQNVDASMGIMKYRWGDAPLRFLQNHLFVPENDTHCFGDIQYSHHIFARENHCIGYTNS